VKIALPFPPKELNPNARHDWRALTPIRSAYRDECYYTTKHQNRLPKLIGGPDPSNYRLTLTFVLPDRRHRDADNMLASVKSGLDGMAMAMGVNDRLFRPITVDWEFGNKAPGFVSVEIEPQYDFLKGMRCAP
jgi:crossover junction endodeoxyribonuclease RusA